MQGWGIGGKKLPRIALYDEFMEIEEAAARHFNLYDPDEPPEESEEDEG